MAHRLRVPRRDLPAPIGAIMVEVAAGFGITPAEVLEGTSCAVPAIPVSRCISAVASRWPRSASSATR